MATVALVSAWTFYFNLMACVALQGLLISSAHILFWCQNFRSVFLRAEGLDLKAWAITQLSVEWGEGGQLPVTFCSSTVGGLSGKAPAPLLPGGVRNKRLPSHPIIPSAIHGEALSRGQEGSGGRKCQSIHQSPALPELLGPRSCVCASLTHSWGPGAGWAGEVHLVMILDFLFGFCPGGFGIG